MNALTYTNDDGKELTMEGLREFLCDLNRHVDALKDIANTRANDSTYEEAGLMLIFAASLAGISKQLGNWTPGGTLEGGAE